MKPTLVDQNIYLIIYPKIKGYLVPALVMFICVIVFGFVIVPQIQAWMADGVEADATRIRIAALNKNKDLLVRLDDAEVASQFRLALAALPSEKDFVGIVNALITTSGSTGIALGDFSFEVGDLSTKSAQLSQKTVFTLGISIKTDQDGVKRFLKVLSQKLPLSEVSSVQMSNGSASISISFDYKPASFQTVEATAPIRSLTVQEKDLLSQLSLWQQGIIDNPGGQSATSSGFASSSPTPTVSPLSPVPSSSSSAARSASPSVSASASASPTPTTVKTP